MLTPRMANFAAAVVAGGSASDAYRQTYPRSLTWAPATVHSASSRLAARPEVAARVADLRRQAETDAVASRTECLIVLTRIIRACAGDLIRADGGVNLAAARRARQEIRSIEASETAQGYRRVKLRLRDPLAAIGLLARLQGWYTDNPSAEVSAADEARLAEIRQALAEMSPEERRRWVEERLRALDAETPSPAPARP